MTDTVEQTEYDVVIVGAGIAGAIVAKQLGKAGKKVLMLEAGAPIPVDRSGYMATFFTANAKTPESPYPPIMQSASGATSADNPLGLPNPADQNAPRYTVLQIDNWRNPALCYFDYTPQVSDDLPETSLEARFAFGSSYERIGGGTTWHWLGTCLRMFPDDFQLKTKYGVGVDWPGGADFYTELVPYYNTANLEIGVSGDAADMNKLFKQFTGHDPNSGTYDFPMPAIDQSIQDGVYSQHVEGMTYEDTPVYVTPTPQGRNSRPGERRQCAGNTNCIPICPIQAKYDGTVTLAEALQTGNVTIKYQCVASNIGLTGSGADVTVSGIDYITYEEQDGPATGKGTAVGKRYVLAAHAIETPKLLLMSDKNPGYETGVANSSGQVGRNLMDHVMYLGWGLAKDPIFPYRGPLSTSGIESLRSGAFRSERSAYRIEIGNEGWQWAANDPGQTLADFVFGQNNSQLNGNSVNERGEPLRWGGDSMPSFRKLFGSELVETLNGIYTRQLRLGYLIEQLPDPENRVELSDTLRDHLGLPRPKITYRLASDYERKGFLSAKQITTELFNKIGATEYTKAPSDPIFNPTGDEVPTSTTFQYQYTEGGSDVLHKSNFKFYGAGHIVGTTKMGDDCTNSVLNPRQQSWDHENLYMVGSSVFPTIATNNPTLTIAALSFQAAENILNDLSIGASGS